MIIHRFCKALKISKKEFYRRVNLVINEVFEEVRKKKKIYLQDLLKLIGLIATKYFPGLKHNLAMGYFKYILRIVVKSNKVKVERGYVIWVGE